MAILESSRHHRAPYRGQIGWRWPVQQRTPSGGEVPDSTVRHSSFSLSSALAQRVSLPCETRTCEMRSNTAVSFAGKDLWKAAETSRWKGKGHPASEQDTQE